MWSICLSDLHFVADAGSDAENEEKKQRLFAQQLQRAVGSRVYILGDLFDYWLGDDISCHYYQPIITLLREAAKHSTIAVMHGNRDFLLGKDFAAAANVTIIDDPHLVTVAGRRLLLTHGDTLLTADHDYQRFRRMVRDPVWQQTFLGTSASERLAVARDLRAQSDVANAAKMPAMFAVDNTAAAQMVATHRADAMIHGHIHRHEYSQLPNGAERYAMLDWQGSNGQVITISDGGVIQHERVSL